MELGARSHSHQFLALLHEGYKQAQWVDNYSPPHSRKSLRDKQPGDPSKSSHGDPRVRAMCEFYCLDNFGTGHVLQLMLISDAERTVNRFEDLLENSVVNWSVIHATDILAL